MRIAIPVGVGIISPLLMGAGTSDSSEFLAYIPVIMSAFGGLLAFVGPKAWKFVNALARRRAQYVRERGISRKSDKDPANDRAGERDLAFADALDAAADATDGNE